MHSGALWSVLLQWNSATLSPHMRAAAILGLGCSAKSLEAFQADQTVEWRMGMPAAGDQVDVILLFGGDGTVHRHLSQLVRLGLPVLVVPAGSGNDFARALGLRRVRDSLAAWRRFCEDGARATNVRTIDLGLISAVENASASAQQSPHYFCCVGGVGIDGEVSRRANRLPRWLRGNGGYLLALAPTIFTFASQSVKILTSDSATAESWTTRSDQPTILAAFANTPVYGGGMKVAPRARMDDGLLDVCIVGGISTLKLLTMLPSVYTGSHLKFREVEYFTSDRVRVETKSPVAVYADGEYVCETPVEVGIHKAALKVVTL
jgi:diacylglycerol kinase (ATP)